MTNIKPMMINFAPDQTQPKTKSKFLKINEGFYINPKQVAIITHGKKPNSTVLLSADTSKMLTVTNAVPADMAKALDVLA